MWKFVLLAVLSLSMLEGQQEGFSGTPLVRIESDAKETKRTELSEAAGSQGQCRIVKRGRKYLWASRGNRELIRSDAGDYVYYVSPEGSGYVKVFTGNTSDGYDYMEHLTTELKTVTYWGKKSD